jgi:hypothetical protein
MDVTDLVDDGRYLYVSGQGGALCILLDSLPFAATLRRPAARETLGGAAR